MTELINRTLLNRYQVQTFVGRGGMADVYKVWDDKRSTHLALKLLRADLAQDRVFLRRFQREAENLARLGMETDSPQRHELAAPHVGIMFDESVDVNHGRLVLFAMKNAET